MPSSTSTTAEAILKPQPGDPDDGRGMRGGLSVGNRTGAASFCRSATRSASSPSVVAFIAALSRSRCSSMDS